MTDCIFCKIVNGDFGTEFVYENEDAVVFKDNSKSHKCQNKKRTVVTG